MLTDHPIDLRNSMIYMLRLIVLCLVVIVCGCGESAEQKYRREFEEAQEKARVAKAEKEALDRWLTICTYSSLVGMPIGMVVGAVYGARYARKMVD